MAKEPNVEKDFDFDIEAIKQEKVVKKEKNVSEINDTSERGNLINISGVSLDLSSDFLIIRRKNGSSREKTLIDLSEIKSTKVIYNSKKGFLVFAIVFLVLCGCAFYPLFKYLDTVYSIIDACVGVVLFLVFLIIYISSKSLVVEIMFGRDKPLKYHCKNTKSFKQINNFFDELFYRKHHKN